jgi:hypothetical protein
VEAFRGAIVNIVGIDKLIFHNHINDNKLLYSYPLIQYKRTSKGNAVLVCMGEGVEEVTHLFTQKNWDVHLSGRTFKLDIDTLKLSNGKFKLTNSNINYQINTWMPLNQENFKRYVLLKNKPEKLKFLEAILIGNILSLAKSLEWRIEETIKISIEPNLQERLVTFKKNKIVCFDLSFKSNVALPNSIGLGKGVSHGFGVIKKIR